MTLSTLNYGNYGIFLSMGNAGFIPSTIVVPFWDYLIESYKYKPPKGTNWLDPTTLLLLMIYIFSITLRTLNDGNYGIFLTTGTAGFRSSTVVCPTSLRIPEPQKSPKRTPSPLVPLGPQPRQQGLGFRGLGV